MLGSYFQLSVKPPFARLSGIGRDVAAVLAPDDVLGALPFRGVDAGVVQRITPLRLTSICDPLDGPRSVSALATKCRVSRKGPEC